MGINDVSRAFKGWLEALTGTRQNGALVAGRWVQDSTPDALSFSGVVQNASPKDLEVLEQGDQSKETIKIHTTFELVATDKTTGTTGDLIPYKSKNWRVVNIAYRFIGNYNKAILVREQ